MLVFLLRLKEEYWFRVVFVFYDSKRSIGFVRFFVFIVFIIFRPFDLGHFHWRRFIGGRDFVSHIIQTLFTDHSHIHLQLKKRVTTN